MNKAKVLLTPAVIATIDQLASSGGTYDSIAEEIGVTKVKLKAWETGNWSIFQALAPAYAKAHKTDCGWKAQPKKALEVASATKPKRRKYDPSLCETVRELGRKGHSILEVSEITGIAHATLCGWEKRVPEFRDAFAGVRRASEYRKKLRLDKLFAKSEGHLLDALERLRARRHDNQSC